MFAAPGADKSLPGRGPCGPAGGRCSRPTPRGSANGSARRRALWSAPPGSVVRTAGAENPARGLWALGARQRTAPRAREAGVHCPESQSARPTAPAQLARGIAKPAMAPDPVAAGTSAQGSIPRYFTWEEVAQRSGREKERWLVIDRKVYNISEFTRRHPGGSRVISHYAGQDATVSAARQGHGRGRARAVRRRSWRQEVWRLGGPPTNWEESQEAPDDRVSCGHGGKSRRGAVK